MQHNNNSKNNHSSTLNGVELLSSNSKEQHDAKDPDIKSNSGNNSTSTENQFIDLENAIRNHVDETNGIYRSCCTMIDSRVLSFAVQSVVILLVLVFSMYQAANTSSLEARQTYIVIVTTILSVYLPTPKIQRDKNRRVPS